MKKSVDLNAIASFYAGKPVKVYFPAKKPGTPGTDSGWGTGGWGGTVWEGNVALGPLQKQMFNDFLGNIRSQRGVANVAGLATLLHEAIHLRNFDPRTGFRESSNESQANALGSELVADALQRFFGIKVGSPLSDRYMKAARNLSGYQGAYPTRRA